MKNLLACVFLLNFMVGSSGFGMKEEKLDGLECDLQETCFGEGSGKREEWEKKLESELKDKFDFYQYGSKPEELVDLIWTVGYGKKCKDALIQMLVMHEKKMEEGVFPKGAVPVGVLIEDELKYIAPIFLPALTKKLGINLTTVEPTFGNFMLIYLEEFGRFETTLSQQEAFEDGVDFVASYIEFVFSSQQNISIGEKNGKV